MQKYTYIYWIHTDAMNNKRRKTSLTKYLPLTLLQGFEKVVWGFTVRGSWRPNITEIFWPQSYGRQRCVVLVLQGCSTGGPGPTLLGNGFLYCILSASSLDSNSSGPQAPSAWCGFPYHISSQTLLPATPLAVELNSTVTPLAPAVELNSTATLRRTQLSYIIVRRPLDLWNRMFNRHQAEITVMQFRGHSLPVHQSMSVPWEFLPRSISSANFRPRDFLS